MKNVYIISLVFLFSFSCDSIDKVVESTEENEGEVTPDFHINNGLNAINEDDFSDAVDYFDFAYSLLDSQKSEDLHYFIQFWHGSSWSKLLLSNTLVGSSDALERFNNRKLSYDGFFKLDSVLNEYEQLLNSGDLNLSVLDPAQISKYRCDAYAGKLLYSDYRVYFYQNKFFNIGALNNEVYLDSLNWFSNGEPDCNELDSDCNGLGNCNGYCESGITNLINSINENSCTEFSDYAPIDINDVYLILIKDYIRNERYQEAYNFINSISRQKVKAEFQVDVNFNLSDDLYLIGDFSNKTIDFSDMYLLTQSLDNPNIYNAEIDLYPSLPCDFSSQDSDSIRNELVECVNTYFNSDARKIFKYKFIIGDYSSGIYGQEQGIGDCLSEDGFRLLENIPNSSLTSISVNQCFNSCSSYCE
ncbi:MAG: hypothetical protein CMG00_03445 [Candidatus Marinimicrobia bacterium]|nr:hypothetical protein [Candidatus Neomarinimicrobiota bacterium]|tara:strand:+ start:816 stop:2063 length:1248 start_codon:yes stop_codon:yes gene_type:complete